MLATPRIASQEQDVQIPGIEARRFGYSLETSLLFGILLGQSEELVYYGAGLTLSQLLWDLAPLVYSGSAVHGTIIDRKNQFGVFGDLGIKAGIPTKTGRMEDRDWLDASTSTPTHYSVHDNFTQNALLIDCMVGMQFPLAINQLFTAQIKGFVAFSYMSFAWEARDGYGEYPWGNPTFSGPVITYTQSWQLLSLGVGMDMPLTQHITWALSFRISPHVWCRAIDNHLNTATYYIDIMSCNGLASPWGIYFEPQSVVNMNLHPRFTLSFTTSFRGITGAQGETWTTKTGSSVTANYISHGYIGGARYFVLDMGLLGALRF